MSSREYICDYCSRSFTRLHNLQVHVENCHMNDTCYCNICDQTFGSPASFQLHMARGHNRQGQPLPECDICGRIFARKQNITSHMLTVHLCTYRPKVYCSVCCKTFTTERNLRRHTNQQHDPKFEYLTCDICSKTFKGKQSLVAHIQTLHASVKDQIKCHLCDKVYTNKRNLKRHIDMSHQDKEAFKCVICQKVYTSNQSLKRHLRLHATGKIYGFAFDSKYESSCRAGFKVNNIKRECVTNVNDGFVCAVCTNIYSEESSLRNHIKIAHTFQDFYNYCKQVLLAKSFEIPVENVKDKRKACYCEFCTHGFNSVYDLKLHMKSIHDMEYTLSTCNVCFRRFHTKETMLEHKKICKPPAGVNPCSHCDKLFTDVTSLEFHLKVFHPQAQIADSNISSTFDDSTGTCFKCDVCARVYNSERSLKHHVKLKHTVDEEVVCRVCDKVCKNKYYLASHTKVVHNDASWSKCKYCDKEFKAKRNIRRHIEFTHMGIQRHKCVACETLFKEKRSLRKHVRIKHPNSDIFPQCHICKKRFESAKSCQIHLKLLHSFNMDTYPCGACTAYFTSEAALDVHTSARHRADNAIYKCAECNIVFEGQTRFARHNEIHHSDGPLIERKPLPPRCIVCVKDFSSRKTLKRHIKNFHHEFDEDELASFGSRRRSFNVECQECLKNFTDDYYYGVYLKLKHIPDSIIFKCDSCQSSYVSFEYAVQRYKQNFDANTNKLYLSELCTAEMDEESRGQTSSGEMRPESATADVTLERPVPVTLCEIKLEPASP